MRRIMVAVWVVLGLAGVASAQSTGRLSVAEATHRVDVGGRSTASITVSGTYTGTVSFEVIGQPGTAAVTVDCATPAAPGSAVNSTTSTGVWVCPVAGMSSLQARMSAYTDGTAVVGILASVSPGQTVAAAGGGGSFDGVLLDAAGGDSLADTANNALRVNIVAGAGSGGTAIADDAAFTVATTSVTPAGGLFDDVAPDSVNEGDAGAVRMSANRNMYTTIRDAAGNERGLNVAADGSIAVTVATVPSHAVTNAGTFATQAAQSGTWTVQPGNTANTTAWLFTGGLANDGAAAATNRLGTLPAVVQNSAPTLTDGRNAAISLTTGGATRVMVTNAAGAAQTLASDVTEDAAETAGGGGPMVLSVRRDTAASSAGTTGDNATFNTDSLGRLWVRPGNPCDDHARVQTAAISNSTSGNVEVVALNGSDLIYVCGYSLMAGAATGVRFVYGTGTACATGETGLTGAWPFAANGGIQQPNTGAPQFVVPAGNAFCTENTGANAIAGHVTYVRTAAP